MDRRKKALRWIIGLFVGTLLALTFLSNTLQGLSLPKVAAERPAMGGLALEVSGEGFLQPAHTTQLYPEGDWKVEEIVTSKNSRVKKGDPLIRFDTSSTRRTLEDEESRYAQQKLQLAKLEDQLKAALRSEEPDGADNQKRDYEAQRLEMQVQQRKLADLRTQIAEGGTLTSPVDGVVTALNASEGALAGRGQPIAEIADDAAGYAFSFTANSNDASPLRIGDKVKVQIDEAKTGSVDGLISDIEDASSGGGAAGDSGSGGDSKKITIEVRAAGLQPGYKAAVSVSNRSRAVGMQIPKSALKQDNNGYYVFTVTEKDGPLGNAYYATKTYITVKDENSDTVLTEGLMPDEQYITEASEPLADGDRVRF